MRLGLGQWKCCCKCGGCNLDEVTVEIAGMVNGTCTACANYDGVYVVPKVDSATQSPSQCAYSLDVTNHCFSVNRLGVQLMWNGTNEFKIRVNFNDGLERFIWEKVLGTSPVCTGSHELDPVFSAFCNNAGSTCTVTLG